MKNSQRPLILGSPDAFGSIFLFDPATLTYEASSRSVTGLGDKKSSGMASTKVGGFAALYKYENRLWAAFDVRAYAVTEALTSNWRMEEWRPAVGEKRGLVSILKGAEAVSSARRFELVQNGTVVEKRSYTILENDPSTRSFVIWDNEDEDFLLWMHNVLYSAERKGVLLETWE